MFKLKDSSREANVEPGGGQTDGYIFVNALV